MDTLMLGAKALSLEEVYHVAVEGRKVGLSAGSISRVQRAHEFLKTRLQSGDVIYGINTGFGLLSNVSIPGPELENLQVNLLRSHAVGTGRSIEDSQVRAMLLLRASNLAQGYSGVSLGL